MSAERRVSVVPEYYPDHPDVDNKDNMGKHTVLKTKGKELR